MSQINLTGKKILVVDDEPVIREVLAERLQACGAELKTADNGTQGLTVALAHDFDLVISDVRMPGGDGMMFLRELRKARADGPVFFFMTGFSDYSVEEAIASGAAYVLNKPFRMQELDAAIRRCLGVE